MGLLDILNQLSGGHDDHQRFDQVAQQASRDDLGAGIADAFRSDKTPPFGSMVGQMFGNSNPNQRADMLNQLIQAAGPAVLGGAAGGGLGSILGRLGLGQPQGGQPQGGQLPRITPEQAQQIRPEDVEAVAHQAGQQDPNVMDQLGRFYADHPDLVRGLGLAAVTVAMNAMRNRMQGR